MKLDDMDRRAMMRALALTPAVLPLFPSGATAATTYAPKFFSASELEIVATLGELILPQTQTPGARAAKAHEYIDLVLADETQDVQHEFRDGLAWVERRSRELFGHGFMELSVEQQTALLTR